jgi:hypothetical protein
MTPKQARHPRHGLHGQPNGDNDVSRILDRLEELRTKRVRKPKPITLPKLKCLSED